ncbi:MAG: C4-type zinc ribbon domain-containing protein [Bacteroidales bacterium]|jgi:predicted  nucleic acid-binding Zn-ribbon protein|nr:C4-type zinc ribbon domain-containing protein [Bacteroidales bacterium]
MTKTSVKKNESANMSITEKLKSLYRLQLIDSEIDRIKTMRGELPLEVRDLEDELAGLETRISNLENEVELLNSQINSREMAKVESQALIKKYTEQQNNVRNNREYDSLTKEIEYQTLEIELSEKKIKEHKSDIEIKNQMIEDAKLKFADRSKDLELKRAELESIIAETQLDEEKLNNEREEIAESIEPRLLYSYSRIRNNVINKLAVVSIERDACGGCFNKIPPQRQLDIKSNRKIIPCEYCGRIIVDPEILEK